MPVTCLRETWQQLMLLELWAANHGMLGCVQNSMQHKHFFYRQLPLGIAAGSRWLKNRQQYCRVLSLVVNNAGQSREALLPVLAVCTVTVPSD